MATTRAFGRSKLSSGIRRLGRIKWNHLIFMLTACVVPLIALYAVVSVFDVQVTNLYWLILLLCPLAHILLMRRHH